MTVLWIDKKLMKLKTPLEVVLTFSIIFKLKAIFLISIHSPYCVRDKQTNCLYFDCPRKSIRVLSTTRERKYLRKTFKQEIPCDMPRVHI